MQQRINVLVLSRAWPTTTAPHSGVFVSEEARALTSLGVQLTVVHAGGRRAVWGYVSIWLKMFVLLHRTQVDLIHAHYGFTGWIARLQLRVPVVVTFHGSDLLGSRDMRSGKPGLAGRLEQLTSMLLARIIDQPIIVSEEMRPLVPPRARLVPAGIDARTFYPRGRRHCRRSLSLPAEESIVIFVADPSRVEKRFHLAEATMAELTGRGVEASLKVIHSQPPVEVALWMGAADALLLTSESEGSPLVVREAVACGLPVVSVDVGDVREHLRDVDECAVVSTPDARSLADALEPLLLRPTRVSAPSQWDSGSAARQVVEIYREVVA